MKSVGLRRVLVLAATAILVGTVACVAPADLDVEVGRSVEIEYKETAGAPAPQAILAHVQESAGHVEDISVRVTKAGEDVVVHLEVWGGELPEGGFAGELQQAFPALQGARIKEEPLQGQVRGTIGAKLGRDLFDLDVIDAKDIEAARQQVMAKLAAQGVQGKVDVQVQDDGGRRKVMIRVENEDCDPPGSEEAQPEPDEPAQR